MHRFSQRVSRQITLPEVGLAGQERIAGHPAELPRQLSASARGVFRSYVQGAGQTAGEVTVDAAARLDELSAVFAHDPSREVGRGALAALLSIKSALKAL